MPISDSQLKAFMLDAALITEEKLIQAEKRAKKAEQKLADFLVDKKMISQAAFPCAATL